MPFAFWTACCQNAASHNGQECTSPGNEDGSTELIPRKKKVSQTDELCQDDSIFRVHKGQFEIVMYILSVDRGEGVVEGPDDVIRIPRAGNNGTQSCGRINNIIQTVNLLKQIN